MASAARLTPSEGRWLRSLHQGVEEVTEAAQLAVHTYHTLVVAPGSRELRSCGAHVDDTNPDPYLYLSPDPGPGPGPSPRPKTGAHVDEEYPGGGVGLHLLGHEEKAGRACWVKKEPGTGAAARALGSSTYIFG